MNMKIIYNWNDLFQCRRTFICVIERFKSRMNDPFFIRLEALSHVQIVVDKP